MTISLAIDASSAAGTVAVLRDGNVIAEGEAVMRSGDREFLLPTVQGALGKAGMTVADLDQVIAGAGPGSFTSLRIAGSIAKAIAHARGIPLLTVPSLGLLITERARAAGRYAAAINALRGEHYVTVATVSDDGTADVPDTFDLVATRDLAFYAAAASATLLGAEPGEAAQPHARGVAKLRATPVDLVSWEPTYGRLAEAQVKWEAAHGRPLRAD